MVGFVLQELAKADAKHFIILFRDSQLQFRSVYSYSPDTEELWKLFGVGPRHITQKMYENLYKYNSGSKQFSKIPSKTMSVSVDGLTIGSSFWLSKKGPNSKKRWVLTVIGQTVAIVSHNYPIVDKLNVKCYEGSRNLDLHQSQGGMCHCRIKLLRKTPLAKLLIKNKTSRGTSYN